MGTDQPASSSSTNRQKADEAPSSVPCPAPQPKHLHQDAPQQVPCPTPQPILLQFPLAGEWINVLVDATRSGEGQRNIWRSEIQFVAKGKPIPVYIWRRE